MKIRTAGLMAVVTLLLATVSHGSTSALSAVARVDGGGNNGAEPTNYCVDVLFSGSMGATSALNPANYSIAGATITNATFFTNNTAVALSNMVILKLTAPLSTSFTLQLTNVLDGLGNPVSNSSVRGTVDPLQSVDIAGVPDGLPIAVPGTTFCTGPGSYAIDASGADINHNKHDSFRFDYTTRTNNFDIVVQVKSLVPADYLSKAALMVRETIDPNDGGSRMMCIAGTPTPSMVPLDGTPIGCDCITGDWRDAPDSAAFAAFLGDKGNVYYSMGDGILTPDYPNEWLRLTRQRTATSDLYTGYTSPDGIYWTEYEHWDAAKDNTHGYAKALPSVVYVGIASCAHIYPGSSYSNALMTATCANFGDYTNNTPRPPITSALNAVARVDEGGNNGTESPNYCVDVLFSGSMDAHSALNPANFSISGATITDATFLTNNAHVALCNMVILRLAAPLTGPFSLNVSTNVKNASDVPVAANTVVDGTVDPLHSVDIPGVPNKLPIAVRGTTFCTGPGGYVINASGADIYNAQDSYRFDYTTRTNNFDVVVQIKSLDPANKWSKAGLMVREKIDPDDGGSRMMFVGGTPSPFSVALDGTIGVGNITGVWRDAPDYPADNLDCGKISYFLTDDQNILVPDYPNQWLRLTRKLTATSDLYTAYSSPDGIHWSEVEHWDAAKNNNYGYAKPFPSVVYVGIESCAHIFPGSSHPDAQMTATYANFGDYVAPSTPAPPAIPSVLSAVARVDDGGNSGAEPANYCVDVLFDQGMIAKSALNPANYAIAGATITNATFFTNNTGVALFDKVILKLAAPLNTSFTLQLTSNVVNNLGNALSNLTVNGTVDSLQSVDIAGVPDKLPVAVRGTTFCTGPGSYAVDASGSDISNTHDSFRFDYTTRTNNFDVVVQIKSLVPADQWSKVGLMVRETNDGGSRMMFVGGTPDLSVAPLDNTIPPKNTITGIWRDGPNTTAFAGDNGNIYHYLGDGVIKPNYPNQWLRLTRQRTATSDLYTAYNSPDGKYWKMFEYWDAAKDNTNGDAKALPSVVYVGIASCAHIYPDSYNPYAHLYGMLLDPDLQVTATYANFGDNTTPAGLSATAGSGQVALAWNASSGASSYNVKRSTTSGGEMTIANVSDNSCTDMNVVNSTTYYYIVQAEF